MVCAGKDLSRVLALAKTYVARVAILTLFPRLTEPLNAWYVTPPPIFSLPKGLQIARMSIVGKCAPSQLEFLKNAAMTA